MQELDKVIWSTMRASDESYDLPEALLVMGTTESLKERVNVTRSRCGPCFQPRQWNSSRTSRVTICVGVDDGTTICIAGSVADLLGEHASLSSGIPATAWASMLFGSVNTLSSGLESETTGTYCRNQRRDWQRGCSQSWLRRNE